MNNLTLTLTTCTKPSLTTSEFYFSDKLVTTGFFAGTLDAIKRHPSTPGALLQLNEYEGQEWAEAINAFAKDVLASVTLDNVSVLGQLGKKDVEPEVGSLEELFCIMVSALALRVVMVDANGVLCPIAEGDVCTWEEAMEGIITQAANNPNTLETYPVVIL